MRAVVYSRFPRNRDGFEDPPVVDWNAAKERELWALSKATSTDFEWQQLAEHFGVPVVYISQQAAWLYEKESGSLRRRMSTISQANRPQNESRSSINAPFSVSINASPQSSRNVQQRVDSSDDSSAQDISATDRISGLTSHSRAKSARDSDYDSTNNNSSSDFGEGLSDSGEFQPFRRLSSTSRIRTGSLSANSSEDSDGEFSDLSLDGFVMPQQLQTQRMHSEPAAPSSSESPSDTDSTVSQSALEAASMEQQSASDSDI